ncbi:MFS transporter [uncultured Desulfosarcina sp.]|uniref:spinster family MFS transporter n=1 Tax=uncultured Desulfosarcina sp. TaxID=218289 RepID=UPI0029C78DE3|nr:MFS transporter [uncultured Desulfosarcina sp.]
MTQSQSWKVFWLLFLLYMFDYMDRMVVVSLFPFLKQDMGITDAQCGLLVSAVYWSILIVSFPASVLVDRWSRTKSISIMAAIWSMATLACAFTRTFSHLFTARAVIGVGEAGYAPGGTAMLSNYFPQEKRARILGLWNASIPLGSALGIGLGGFVAHHFGWRHAFGLVALPGLVLAILFYFVRDYPTVRLTKKAPSGEEKKLRFNELTRQFTHNRTLVCNNLAFALNVFVTTSLLTWLPTYFHRFDNLAMDEAGMKASSIMILAIIGAPLGGFLSDAWMKKRENARLLFPAVSSVVTGILLWVAFTFLRGNAQYGVLFLIGISAVAFVPSCVAVTQDVVHPGLRAISLSLNIIIQHLLGSSLAPVVIGRLSDVYGLDKALTFLPGFAFLAGVLLFAGSFFYKDDLFK